MQEKNESPKPIEETVSFPLPKLDLKDKLYVRTYLHTLSHPEAHRTVSPGVKGHNDNPWSRKESVQYHISLALQSKAESLSLDPNKIIERLYHEAIREGNGSNHSARIQALNLLGKHLGMFAEEKKGDTYQINIVNYSPDSNTLIEKNEPPTSNDYDSIEDQDNKGLINFTNFVSNETLKTEEIN